jgi:hypothetical protein
VIVVDVPDSTVVVEHVYHPVNTVVISEPIVVRERLCPVGWSAWDWDLSFSTTYVRESWHVGGGYRSITTYRWPTYVCHYDWWTPRPVVYRPCRPVGWGTWCDPWPDRYWRTAPGFSLGLSASWYHGPSYPRHRPGPPSRWAPGRTYGYGAHDRWHHGASPRYRPGTTGRTGRHRARAIPSPYPARRPTGDGGSTFKPSARASARRSAPPRTARPTRARPTAGAPHRTAYPRSGDATHRPGAASRRPGATTIRPTARPNAGRAGGDATRRPSAIPDQPLVVNGRAGASADSRRGRVSARPRPGFTHSTAPSAPEATGKVGDLSPEARRARLIEALRAARRNRPTRARVSTPATGRAGTYAQPGVFAPPAERSTPSTRTGRHRISPSDRAGSVRSRSGVTPSARPSIRSRTVRSRAGVTRRTRPSAPAIRSSASAQARSRSASGRVRSRSAASSRARSRSVAPARSRSVRPSSAAPARRSRPVRSARPVRPD